MNTVSNAATRNSTPRWWGLCDYCAVSPAKSVCRFWCNLPKLRMAMEPAYARECRRIPGEPPNKERSKPKSNSPRTYIQDRRLG